MAINIYSKDSVDNLLSAKLSISSLSNAATSTLNATAPTTGQALTFDGTDLVWATVGGGGSFDGGTVTNAIVVDESATSGYSTTYAGAWISMAGGSMYVSQEEGLVSGFNIQLPVGGTITFGDSTTQTTAAVAGPNFGDAFTLGKVQNVSASSGYWEITFAPVNSPAMMLGLSVSLSDGTSSESITSFSSSSTWTYTTTGLSSSDYIYLTYNGQRSSIAISNP